MTNQNILIEKLQATLEDRFLKGRLIEPASPAKVAQAIDFGSNDTLSISSSGELSKEFLKELHRHPNFTIGSTASRILEGTSQYMIEVENFLADFHNVESALFFNSGFEANVAIWSVIPQPGDFVIYDEYVHASIHDGLRKGRAKTMPFAHSDCADLRRCLLQTKNEDPGFAEGRKNIFISLESFYSMDGDGAPIQEIVELAKEIFPRGNVLLVIDEAHSNGIVGPRGSGYISHFGLEKEFVIRLHTFGKGLGSSGGRFSTSS